MGNGELKNMRTRPGGRVRCWLHDPPRFPPSWLPLSCSTGFQPHQTGYVYAVLDVFYPGSGCGRMGQRRYFLYREESSEWRVENRE